LTEQQDLAAPSVAQQLGFAAASVEQHVVQQFVEQTQGPPAPQAHPSASHSQASQTQTSQHEQGDLLAVSLLAELSAKPLAKLTATPMATTAVDNKTLRNIFKFSKTSI